MSRTITYPTSILFATMAGCQSGPAPIRQATATDPTAATHELGRAPDETSSPLTVDVTPSLKGSRSAVLRTNDTVASGDSIHLAVTTSIDAHLYVAYCDRASELTVFPPQGSIETKAHQVAYAPHRDADIVVDDQVGTEVLYVIASRRRLDIADPELAAAMSRARPDAAIADCKQSLQRLPDRTHRELIQSPPPPRTSQAVAPGKPSVHADRTPPPAGLERGGYIRWRPGGEVSAGADHDDIVVLRYSFTHVAR